MIGEFEAQVFDGFDGAGEEVAGHFVVGVVVCVLEVGYAVVEVGGVVEDC